MFSPDSRLSRIMGMIFDVLIIGILWFVCSLPVITIVAAATASYYTMAKVVRAGEGYMLSEYVRSFRMNFKQSLIPAIIYVIVMFVLVIDMICIVA